MLNKIQNDKFRYELSHFAIEYMKTYKDLGKAITSLLEKVALYFDFSHVTILENKKNLQYLSVTYEWCQDKAKSSLNHVIYYSDEFKELFLKKIDINSTILQEECSKFSSYNNIHNMVQRFGSKTFIALPYIVKDRMSGLITFESSKEGHIFTNDEVQSLYQLKNIYEFYYWLIREYHETKDKLEQITRYDAVTGLFNYDTFIKKAEFWFEHEKTNSKYVVIYADIVNFKFFNEFYGYSAGDEVLRLFNQSITLICDNNILACRIFSDYFVLLGKLEQGMDEKKIIRAIDAFSKIFSDKVRKLYKETSLQIAAGVNIFTETNLGIKTYIDNANMARKLAKRASRRSYIYNETMDNELKRHILISNIADDALRQNEFYFELQPKYHLKDKLVIGAEALVRWRRPDGTMMYPNEFIPVFEQNEFIVKLDFYVYAKVCDYLKSRIDNSKKVIPISVNVSRIHLRYNDFVKRVIQLVDFYQVPHNLLEFEITESIFLENARDARNAMIKLKNAGFLVSMDDFGSGYSSLNLLKNLDFDILKLDKEFLNGGRNQKKEEVVIESIISMAKKMQILVLCEGVETREQAEFLEELECDLVQGYFYGKPMVIEQFDLLYECELV